MEWVTLGGYQFVSLEFSLITKLILEFYWTSESTSKYGVSVICLGDVVPTSSEADTFISLGNRGLCI